MGFEQMSDSSKSLIFGSILRSFLATFEGGIVSMTDDIVAARYTSSCSSSSSSCCGSSSRYLVVVVVVVVIVKPGSW